jgi:PAS domain S-box-containing protein
MDEMVHTLHELRVHQIQLELQNEELRQSKNALDQSHARFRDLYHLVPVGYFTVNDESRIVQANVCGATLLGLTRAALLNKRMDSFVLPEDRDTLHFLNRQLGHSGALQVRELRMVRRDGTLIWVHLAATAAEDAPGVDRYFGTQGGGRIFANHRSQKQGLVERHSRFDLHQPPQWQVPGR